MQLNEIIEENTLEQIGRRTRLSPENLEKLFAHDFKGLTKVKALGFISILEREYRADLSELRQECLEYFGGEGADAHGHSSSQDEHSSLRHTPPVTNMQFTKSKARYIKPIMVLLLVAILSYVAWQTFDSSTQSDDNATVQVGDAGFLSSIINQTKTWINGDAPASELDENNTQEPETNSGDNSFVIDDKPTKSETQKSTQQIEKTNNVAPNTPTNDTQKPTDENNAEAITATEPKKSDDTGLDEIKKIGDAIEKADSSSKNSDDGMLSSEVPSMSQNDKPTKKQDVVQKTEEEIKAAAEAKAREEEARRMAEEEQRRAEAELAKQQAAEEEARRLAAEEAARAQALKAAREKAAREKAAKEKARLAKIVHLIPRAKIWLGIVDLTTMKRTTSVGKNKINFENPKGKWIVATGHGRLEFKVGDKVVKFNDGKKHYLLLKPGSVQEISHEKFQQLNKSKVW